MCACCQVTLHHSYVVPFVLENESSFVGILGGKHVGTPTRPVPLVGTSLDFVSSFESLGRVQGNVYYLLFLGVSWR
jgi:hypothetical protein